MKARRALTIVQPSYFVVWCSTLAKYISSKHLKRSSLGTPLLFPFFLEQSHVSNLLMNLIVGPLKLTLRI